MSEELRVNFAGEVSEKVGPELTQSLDRLASSLDSLTSKGAGLPPGASVAPIAGHEAQWWNVTPEGQATRERELERIRTATYGLAPTAHPMGPGFRMVGASERKSLAEILAEQAGTANLRPGEIPLEGPIPRPPHLPPPLPGPPPTWGQRMAQNIGQQGAGLAGSAVGGIVGAATGSPTLGALAGVGTQLAISAAMAGHPELGLFMIAASALTETFHKLDSVVKGAAENLAEYDARVARAYAQREVAMIRERLAERGRIGGLAAEYVGQQTRIDVEWERMKTELVKGVGGPVMEIKELLLTALSGWRQLLELLNDAKAGVDKLPDGLVNGILASVSPQTLLGKLIWDAVAYLRDIAKNTKKDEILGPTPSEWLDDLMKSLGPMTGDHVGAAFKQRTHPRSPARLQVFG